MSSRNITIIVLACIITAVLVGVEVYFWQGGSIKKFLPGLPVNTINIGNFQAQPGSGGVKPNTNTNLNEIKTKEEGIAACEYNRAYAKTVADAEQKKMGEAMVGYCYAVIAGKFNDLSLCGRTIDKNTCEQTAKELIEMGKEIQNLPPEERQKMQDLFKIK